MNGDVPWCVINPSQYGSVGAAVPPLSGAVQDVPRPDVTLEVYKIVLRKSNNEHHMVEREGKGNERKR